jgi:NAD(P)H dehydrogenase (quinone)
MTPSSVAESVKSGIESAGGSTAIYQYVFNPGPICVIALLTGLFRIAETLPEEVLAKMYAPAKPSYPIITPSELADFDAFIFGIPTRYGNFPAQWKVRL